MIDNPIDMILPCPRCGLLHVDAPEPGTDWTNPPHKSHLCHLCGVVWRPADIPTNGVAATKTKGDRDTWTPTYPPASEPETPNQLYTRLQHDPEVQALLDREREIIAEVVGTLVPKWAIWKRNWAAFQVAADTIRLRIGMERRGVRSRRGWLNDGRSI